MIFPSLLAPSLSQVGEQVLLDASKTIANGGDEVTLVEIKPSSSDTFIDVTNSNSLIWIYQSAGSYTAEVRINSVETISVTFEIVTVEQDKLFSNDQDLLGIESEILDCLKDGLSTHNVKHREAQKLILEKLNARGLRDSDGNEITKENIAITKELNAWSRYLTLYLIFFDMAVEEGSIFWEKAMRYKTAAENASRDRQFLSLDSDGTGPLDPESFDMSFTTATVVRR